MIRLPETLAAWGTPAFADRLRQELIGLGADAEAELVRALLADPSAQPTLSLLALRGERALGHILFSRARLEPDRHCSIALLAPLAVVPSAQGRGIGGRLIAAGLASLAASGVELVFVLGHPGYYPRHGFRPAGALGFAAPYPIPPEHGDAWMVLALRPGMIGRCRGKLICARALDRPEYWREED